MAATCPDARKGAEHSVSDVAAIVECGWLHELSGQHREGVREGSGRCRRRCLPRLRLSELAAEYESGNGCDRGYGRHLRGGDLLHG